MTTRTTTTPTTTTPTTTTPTATTRARTGSDAHGNPASGDADGIALYDRTLDRLLRYAPDVIDLAGELTAPAARTPMGSALVAYLHLMSTDAVDLPVARECLGHLDAHAANERERMHATAIEAWATGEWEGAAGVLDEVLQRWPTDLLALMFGHLLDFSVGDAHTLRDRPLRTLREIDPEHPHAPFVLGMAAFGLEEAGHYEQAREAGMRAVAANPDDVWAIHAVAHTYEMQGMAAEAIAFMEGDGTRWESGNLFTVHNWWHLALFHLEAGRIDRVLDIYDAEVHNGGSAGVPIEMLDASAMLWRLHLDGIDTGGRFHALADAWMPKVTDPWYVFNDVHAVMALAGAGRLAQARTVIRGLEAWLPNGTGSNVAMTARVGLPAARALVAFAEDRHDDVVDELLPIRRTFHLFGGSHAQRDVLQRTLLESALRAGRPELARWLTAERLGMREASVHSWVQRARALDALGDAAGAQAASGAAAAHRRRAAGT